MSYKMKEITEHSSDAEVKDSLEQANVPGHIWSGLLEWIRRGRKPGHFLTCLLTNDLLGTVNRADGLNMVALKETTTWLQNCAPATCHGSQSAFNKWYEDHQEHAWDSHPDGDMVCKKCHQVKGLATGPCREPQPKPLPKV